MSFTCQFDQRLIVGNRVDGRVQENRRKRVQVGKNTRVQYEQYRTIHFMGLIYGDLTDSQSIGSSVTVTRANRESKSFEITGEDVFQGLLEDRTYRVLSYF